uniref:putative F-box protein At1g12855 n=1 Tax=Erigeron canadensis TaxID=72917 RepID=UPI001CB91B3E|nr:putative F-box protein At1g12855 [Erigeron canadensis]
MVLYNPLTRATSKPIIPDLLHSHPCNKKHVYGYGYGSSTPDDLKIVRFRGCDQYSSSSTTNDNERHTCDVFSTKTNSWTVLRDFVQGANWLNDVGTFANGSLYWISNRYDREFKIVALDVNNMLLSDIQVPNIIDHGLIYNRRRRRDLWGVDDSHSVNLWAGLGTLNGCLCIVSHQTITTSDAKKDGFNVWVMKEEEGVADNKSWLNVSTFYLDLKSEFGYSPISILDDGNVLILIESFQELVIYDALMKKGCWPSYKVINISASPGCFQRIHGIEYVETLVSPSSLLIA